MKRMSLTTRLSLLFMLAVTAVLGVAGLTLGSLSQHHFMQLDRQTLSEKLHSTQNILAELTSLEQFAQVQPRLRALLGAHRDLTAIIVDSQGVALFAEPSPINLPQQLRDSPSNELWQWQDQGHMFRGLSAQASVPSLSKPLRVLLILDITAHMSFFSALQRWFWIGLLISALVSVGLGWLIARSGLRPLRQVTQVASSISATSLHARLPVHSTPLELQPLVNSFNAMLARLDDDFMRLSNFSADIAHELRTPVSNLMTQTEVVLSQPRANEDYQEVLYANLDDLKRMTRMIDDMLFLAKADNGLLIPAHQPIALQAAVDKLFEYYRLLADEQGIELQLQGHGQINGDRLMLDRTIANLLSNALRYTPSGATIQVNITQQPQGTVLSVSNPGPSIADEHLARLFDRFYRVDAARREGHSNVGLGLAISRSIMTAHSGRIECSCANGITTFYLHFPALAIAD